MNIKFYSEYNLDIGILKIKKYIKYMFKNKYRFCGITDYFSLGGSIQFFKNCIDFKIKPIIGCEILLYFNSNIYGRITIYINNNNGYKNLCMILNKSWRYYSKYNHLIYKYKWLKKQSIKGLYFVIGGYKSILFNLLKKKKVKYILKFLKKIKFDFFLEIQRFNKISKNISKKIIYLSSKLEIPIICSHPIKFLDKKDINRYISKYCILNKIYLEKFGNKKKLFNFKCLNKKKFLFLFQDIKIVYKNTIIFSKMCNFNLFKKTNLKNKCNISFVKRIIILFKKFLNNIENKNKYIKRFFKEINIIIKTGYLKYFYIIFKIVKWSKNRNIQIGPGRGSCASSLLAYILKITDVDPLKYGLIFERFLGGDKKLIPDFDIDICQNSRNKVINYVKKKYGKKNVLNIVTYGRFSLKSSIRDSGRILGIKYNIVNNIINNCYKNDSLTNKVLKYSYLIKNLIKNIGIHAAGIVILEDTDIPIFYIKNKKNFVTQFDKKDVEIMKFIKIDLLGLTTLSIINDIKKQNKINIEFSDLNLKNKNVFTFLSKGFTNGVFQLESSGIRKIIVNLIPTKFNDLVDIISLYRPGPINLIYKYINKKNTNKFSNIRKLKILDILKKTSGIIIYQEQVIKILKKIFSIDYRKANILRIKLSNHKNFKKIKKYLFKRSILNYKKTKIVFNMLNKSLGYCFNKAHATSYSLITFYMLWLKINYYVTFIVKCINFYFNNHNKIKKLIFESFNNNIKLYLIDINYSNYNFKVINNKSYIFGFNIIKGIGIKVINEIIKERSLKLFKSFSDFYRRINKSIVNVRIINTLIYSGAFDFLYKKNILAYKYSILKIKNKLKFKINKNDQFYLFLIKKIKILGLFICIPNFLYKKKINNYINKYKTYTYGIVINILKFSNFYIIELRNKKTIYIYLNKEPKFQIYDFLFFVLKKQKIDKIFYIKKFNSIAKMM
ncbi:DNA polymerase III subunit alpha [Candidatus Vidania fulgoroideorum]